MNDRRKNDKLETISERVYNASFILTVILILGATIGTATVRYITGSEIILVPDNVFKFIEHIIWIFATPLTVKLVGDKLPLVVQALLAWKGNPSLSPFDKGDAGSSITPIAKGGLEGISNTAESLGTKSYN